MPALRQRNGDLLSGEQQLSVFDAEATPFMGPVFAPGCDKIAKLNTRADGTGIPVYICQTCRQVSFHY